MNQNYGRAGSRRLATAVTGAGRGQGELSKDPIVLSVSQSSGSAGFGCWARRTRSSGRGYIYIYICLPRKVQVQSGQGNREDSHTSVRADDALARTGTLVRVLQACGFSGFFSCDGEKQTHFFHAMTWILCTVVGRWIFEQHYSVDRHAFGLFAILPRDARRVAGCCCAV